MEKASTSKVPRINSFMSENRFSEQFKKVDFTTEILKAKEYEDCTFHECNFSSCDLSGITFIECTFIGSNLSTAKLSKTAFKDCKFTDCKMLGLHFHDCNDFLFEVRFENCVLNLSSFYKLKLKKTVFRNCSLQEIDFSECDLTGASFDACDLSGAIFDRTIIEQADFRTALNYTFDPENNKIKKAKFSADGIPGLLTKYNIIIE